MDDGFIISDGTFEQLKEIIEGVRERASSFAVEVETTPRSNIMMLGLRIYFGPRHSATGFLDFGVNRKESSVGIPLSPTSARPANVHRSWPMGLSHRFRRLSATKAEESRARREFEHELSRVFVSLSDLQNLQNTRQERTTILIMPHRDVGKRTGIPKLIQFFQMRWRALGHGLPVLGVGWKLASPYPVSETRLRCFAAEAPNPARPSPGVVGPGSRDSNRASC